MLPQNLKAKKILTRVDSSLDDHSLIFDFLISVTLFSKDTCATDVNAY